MRKWLILLFLLLFATPLYGQYFVQTISSTPTGFVSLQTRRNAFVYFNITLTANVTVSFIDIGVAGARLDFNICQDAVGGRTWSWPSNFQNTPVISTGPNMCTPAAFLTTDGFTWTYISSVGNGAVVGGAPAIVKSTIAASCPPFTGQDSLQAGCPNGPQIAVNGVSIGSITGITTGTTAPGGSCSAGQLYFNTTTNASYYCNGGAWAINAQVPFTALSASATLTATQNNVLATAGAAGITLTLPTAVGIGGTSYYIKRADSGAGNVLINTTSAQTCDGVLNGSTCFSMVSAGQFAQFTSDGTNWRVANASAQQFDASRYCTSLTGPERSCLINGLAAIPAAGGSLTIPPTTASIDNSTAAVLIPTALKGSPATISGTYGASTLKLSALTTQVIDTVNVVGTAVTATVGTFVTDGSWVGLPVTINTGSTGVISSVADSTHLTLTGPLPLGNVTGVTLSVNRDPLSFTGTPGAVQTIWTGGVTKGEVMINDPAVQLTGAAPAAFVDKAWLLVCDTRDTSYNSNCEITQEDGAPQTSSTIALGAGTVTCTSSNPCINFKTPIEGNNIDQRLELTAANGISACSGGIATVNFVAGGNHFLQVGDTFTTFNTSVAAYNGQTFTVATVPSTVQVTATTTCQGVSNGGVMVPLNSNVGTNLAIDLMAYRSKSTGSSAGNPSLCATAPCAAVQVFTPIKLTMKDLTIDINGLGAGLGVGNAISLNYCVDTEINHIQFINLGKMGSGLTFNLCKNSNAIDNTFQNVTGGPLDSNSITTANTYHFKLLNNHLQNAGELALELRSAHGLVQNNTCEGVQNQCLNGHGQGIHNVTFNDNHINASSSKLIALNGAGGIAVQCQGAYFNDCDSDNTISNNDISNTQYDDGISVFSSSARASNSSPFDMKNISITGNTVRNMLGGGAGAGQLGILVKNCRGCAVNNNVVKDVGGFSTNEGILVEYSDQLTVGQNIIINSLPVGDNTSECVEFFDVTNVTFVGNVISGCTNGVLLDPDGTPLNGASGNNDTFAVSNNIVFGNTTNWNFGTSSRILNYHSYNNLNEPPTLFGAGSTQQLLPATFANIGAPNNGSSIFCTDCNATCAAGASTGRTCFRENGAWVH